MAVLARIGLTRNFLIAVIAISLIHIFLHDVWWKQLVTGNEGVNAIMAVNMVDSFEKVIRPSYVPGGYSDWVHQDFPAIGNTPFHSGLLAVGQWAFGLRGVALVSYLAFLSTLYFSFRIVAIWNPSAAWLTVLMMVLSSQFLWLSQLIQFEPVLTAFGISGLHFFIQGVRKEDLLRSAIGGALIGFAFLIKLWLILPVVLAALGFLAYHYIRLGQPLRVGLLLTAILGFLATASLHLLLVAIYSPEDLKGWLSDVYFGVFLNRGISGSKWEGLAAFPNWAHPFWYYPVIIFRDYYVLIICIILGAPLILRNRDRSDQQLVWLVVGGLLSIAVLSIPVIKEPLYLLPALPFLFMLAGICASAFIPAQGRPRISQSLFRFDCIVLSILLGILWIAYAMGLKRDELTLSYLIQYTFVLCFAMGLLYSVVRGRSLRPLVILAITAGLYTGLVVDDLKQRPPVVAIAELIRPVLVDAQPSVPSFVSPTVHVLEFYLFRKGDYWEGDFFAQVQNKKYLAYVVGPEEQKNPSFIPALEYLTKNLVEKTADHGIYRIFLRRLQDEPMFTPHPAFR